MTDKPNDLLLLAGNILTIILQAALAFAGIVLLLLIPVLLFNIGDISTEITTEFSETASDFPTLLVIGVLLFATCLLYTSPSPRDRRGSRMPSSA